MKHRVADLALFGGDPAFAEPLHVGRPNIGNRKILDERIADVLDRRWLTNGGKYLHELEHRIAERIDVKHCVAMCNATIALEIVVRALGLTGEVIVPSFTFIATAHILSWQGITPVFCDIDPRTHNLDPRKVEEMITSRTTGILGVHCWGRPCEIDLLNEIAESRGLKLFFDSAHAIGCSYKGRMIGGFGAAEVFSFHATKFLNSFEGGAVVTNDDNLAQKCRFMRNFGFVDYDRTADIGINGKMNELSAAMGLTSFESMDRFIEINRRNYRQYRQELAELPGLKVITYDEAEQHNYQFIVCEVDEAVTGLGRDQLITILQAENVLARRYFYPGCHRLEPYRSLYPSARRALPQTERISERVLSLPTGEVITPQMIAGVCNIIRTALGSAAEIRKLVEEIPASVD